MSQRIIDAHAHCGILDRSMPQTFEDYRGCLEGSGIAGAVLFAPVMEVYDRYDFDFEDTPQWRARREQANRFLTALGSGDFQVIPYFFIWNDFAVEQLTPQYKGIKWHRHADEPPYRYEDPRCRAAIEEIRRRRMPVVLEEEGHHTLCFIRELAAGVRVIIPHCGLLNGGFELFCREKIWELPNVFADTALAPPQVIRQYLNRYGSERVLFGSDFPFGHPRRELEKVLRLDLPATQVDAVIGANLERLLRDSNCETAPDPDHSMGR
jgi:predicted TIM-barrel fold metal-dependent hydrolase